MFRPMFLFLYAWAVFAQSPVFEVASVKPARGGEGLKGSVTPGPGSLTMQNVSLRWCLTEAAPARDA